MHSAQCAKLDVQGAGVQVVASSCPVLADLTMPTPMPARPLLQVPRGVGSGFIWDKAGHVITNNHVVAGASEVKVTTSDGTVHKARVSEAPPEVIR